MQLNAGAQAIKPLEGNVGVGNCNLGLGGGFFDVALNIQTMTGNKDQSSALNEIFFPDEGCCYNENSLIKWGKTFANIGYTIGLLLARIYEELLKLWLP